jgi:hypothetical protein
MSPELYICPFFVLFPPITLAFATFIQLLELICIQLNGYLEHSSRQFDVGDEVRNFFQTPLQFIRPFLGTTDYSPIFVTGINFFSILRTFFVFLVPFYFIKRLTANMLKFSTHKLKTPTSEVVI